MLKNNLVENNSDVELERNKITFPIFFLLLDFRMHTVFREMSLNFSC